jgi:hypothetical protein
MTQPKFAPILENDEVRELYKLPPAQPWITHRPADFRARPAGVRKAGTGSAGPDQGYALLLADRLADRVRLVEGEHLDDVLQGAGAIAMRRSALFGRAPVKADLELPLVLFGFIDAVGHSTAADGPGSEVLGAREAVFRGVAHDYSKGRRLADLLPESTLRLGVGAIAAELSEDPLAFGRLTGLTAAPAEGE